jgi:hypothetical protein
MTTWRVNGWKSFNGVDKTSPEINKIGWEEEDTNKFSGKISKSFRETKAKVELTGFGASNFV